MKVRDEKMKARNEQQCGVCYNPFGNVPCGHTMCIGCTDKFLTLSDGKKCHICRGPIKDRITAIC